ncbi:Aste57867_20082 [Aphanomyces stellatus]|uniref:Aste57867_20082 protein n=1 Tax=Aphanomyces stellatus TaxID=120398 RepID=A0A485LE98_9STRA|nr:hypothetical protein As57867_020016 [Aphanomyces stellatus]VFT96777.1 Aste57867_20082 [Aphanomyces stellatus]
MTDYVEEQMMEVEALDSIYMDDFSKVQDAPLKLKVKLVPNQDGGDNHVALSLVFTMPETYPDAAPDVEIRMEKGLSDRQEKEIRALLNQQMEENLGMAMVYTVCEAVREWMLENNREGNDGSEYQEMLRRQEARTKKDNIAAEAEQAKLDLEEEKKGAHKAAGGTPVTVESFTKWKAAFDADMATKDGSKAVVGAEKKLTGRQLWASGAAKEDASTDAGDVDIQVEGEDYGDDDDDDDEDYVDGEEGDDDDDE